MTAEIINGSFTLFRVEGFPMSSKLPVIIATADSKCAHAEKLREAGVKAEYGETTVSNAMEDGSLPTVW